MTKLLPVKQIYWKNSSEDFGYDKGWAVVPGQCRETGTEACGTSGTGSKIRGTVPSRPLPIPGYDRQSLFPFISL